MMTTVSDVNGPGRPLRITALAGGVGGARFLRGLLAHLAASPDPARREAQVTVVSNTADDVTFHGLRISPDLDSVMYTLGGGIDEVRGWGRAQESSGVAAELAAYGAEPSWFTLGDKDIATHLVRTRMLAEGATLSEVTAHLCERWAPGVRLLPMTDDVVETHVDLADGPDGACAASTSRSGGSACTPPSPPSASRPSAPRGLPRPRRPRRAARGGRRRPAAEQPRRVHRHRPAGPGDPAGDRRDAAPVVGVSPVIAGAPVRGMADACLAAIGVPTTAAAVAGLYADFLDGWLIAAGDEAPTRPGLVVRRRPLLMSSPAATAELAGAALDLALELVGRERAA